MECTEELFLLEDWDEWEEWERLEYGCSPGFRAEFGPGQAAIYKPTEGPPLSSFHSSQETNDKQGKYVIKKLVVCAKEGTAGREQRNWCVEQGSGL